MKTVKELNSGVLSNISVEFTFYVLVEDTVLLKKIDL